MPKRDTEKIADAKKNYDANKMALVALAKELKKTEAKYKKKEVAYLISIGKIKAPKILTPKEKKIAQQAALAKMLLVQYLREKAVVNSQKLLYEDAVYENKEAKKLDYKEKIDSTAKLIESRKAKLDELEAIFKPFKELKENFDQFNKAVKEERTKDIESTKKLLLSCKKAIEEVQAPLIASASNTSDQNKT
jgi:hypothetical protein